MLDLLLSSGKKGRTETLAVGPSGELAFLFYLKTEDDPASET
jgi:hypothetical protein